MTWKRLASLVAGASMALSTAVAVAPAAHAQTDPVNDPTEVTYVCRGNNPGNAPGSPITVTTTAPASVAPGEVFTVVLDPGEMRNNSRNHARFTYDIALPDNATLVDSRLVGRATNMGGTPSLVRVNSQTKVNQADGDALRIWGGASARWGTSSGTGNSGGLTVSSNQNFRFPTVEMTFRAPLDATAGDEIVVGLAGTGPNSSAAGAQLMYSGNTGGFFGSNFQNECAASANAAQLASVTVSEDAVVQLDSTTRIVGGDQAADSSIPVPLRAQVSAQYASAGEISQGTVTFRNADTDEVLGVANPDAGGYAEIAHEFPRVADDAPEVQVNIVAEYSGVEGNIEPSEDSIVLTLTPKPVVQWNTDFNLRATIGQLDEDSLPVTVTATFQRPGLEYPEGTLVQLYRNGVAVGDPVPVPESDTTLTWEDDVPRAERTATHRYTVELETIRVEYDQWTGSTPNPAAVIVTGTGGEDAPAPGTGSLDVGSLSGSAEGSLTDSVGYDVAPLSGVMPELTSMLSSAS
ncbi:hypothetical protein [Dietzia sp. 179-F 9C3 NHS]|uniref:hypothetical protein n=1 Tax=Dietzia sp. 179-F 9C3 NHS TaxID=3374295 RepID=UPI003879E0C0